MSNRYLTVDSGKFHPQNFLWYFIIMIFGFAGIREIPETLPVVLIMAFVGASILAKQILNARRDGKKE